MVKSNDSDSPKSDLDARLALETDELHRPEIDAFVARNRETLNESIRRSLDGRERGGVSRLTIQDIIANGQRRLREQPSPAPPHPLTGHIETP